MMEQFSVQRIFEDRQIAYAVTDFDLKISTVGGKLEIFSSIINSDQKADYIGEDLLDLVPELVGYEPEIAAVLSGRRSRHQITMINREIAPEQFTYVTLVNLTYRDEGGEISGIIHCVEDITEFGDLEQSLTQQRNELFLLRDRLAAQNLEMVAANKELQQLDDLKSQFVSVAAHELRTPLSSISGYVEMLLEDDIGPLTGEQRRYLEVVQRGSNRLMYITNNLLDITRIETGRFELIMQSVNLFEMVELAARESQPLLDSKNQQIFLDVEPNVPHALCDENRVMQILGNLLSNASKYTPMNGKITLGIRADDEDGFVQIRVADTGIGIDPQEHTQLFEPFFRASNVHEVSVSGVGLGLHITRSLVELHGGRIWLESKRNQGATFFVTLPADDI